MTRTELLARRWAAQGLHSPETTGPEAVVHRLGAVQAQDARMVLAAVALRGRGLSAADVVSALDRGTLIRTHVLRPTWHLVTVDDVRWMTAFGADHIRAVARTNQRARGMTEAELSTALRVAEAALQDGPQTREHLVAAFVAAGLSLDDNRPAHFLMNAEVAAVICSGPGGTYDLVERRIPPAAPIPRDEALARLASRYITGHGPASDLDFAWWAGLNRTEARRGLQAADGLAKGTYEGALVWFDPAVEPLVPQGVHWLPAFDEYLLAFADRSAAIDPADATRWVTKNGIFYPVILHDGRVVGRWLRPERHGRPVRVEWFHGAVEGWEGPHAAFGAWWSEAGEAD